MVGGSNLPGNRHLIDSRSVHKADSFFGDGSKLYRDHDRLAGCVAIPDYRQALDGSLSIYTFRTSPTTSNRLTCYSLTIPSRFETDSMTA